ncbi:hypothetical protein ACK32R_03700 [Aeromonas dhakensis]|uniref:hypothetical protein n=1 Tax=Aeromonas dhakensis TaxID=196024 RepID=UPI0039869BF4
MLLGPMFLASEHTSSNISEIILREFSGSSGIEKSLRQYSFINSFAFERMTNDNFNIYSNLMLRSFELFNGSDEKKSQEFYTPLMKIAKHTHFDELKNEGIIKALNSIGVKLKNDGWARMSSPCVLPVKDISIYADYVCVLVKNKNRTDMIDSALAEIDASTLKELNETDINRIAWAFFDSLHELRTGLINLELEGLRRMLSRKHAINQALEKLGDLISTGLVEKTLVNKCMVTIIQPDFQYIESNKNDSNISIRPLAEACLKYGKINVGELTSVISEKVGGYLDDFLVQIIGFHPMFNRDELSELLTFLTEMEKSSNNIGLKLQADYHRQHALQHMTSRFDYNAIMHEDNINLSNIIEIMNYGVNAFGLDILDAKILAHCDFDALIQHDQRHHGNSLNGLMNYNSDILGEMISKRLHDKMNELTLPAASITKPTRQTI